MKRIYLDHSATTPIDKNVLRAMAPYFNKKFGNPSSIHTFGQEAAAAVDRAREQAAEFLNCEADEIIFTSGATESDNLAIKGFIRAIRARGVKNPHIIITRIEHPAVLEPCAELAKEGAEVTYLPIRPNGVVDMEKFKKSIKDNTVLVSVMYVNSEVGSVQPIREIGKIIKKLNRNRSRQWQNAKPLEREEGPCPVYFHTDATQAINFFNCDVKWNYLDMISLSGHKIYGPKGIGALYVKSGTPLRAVQTGGHQEKNLRSGTLNVPGIVGLGEVLSHLRKTAAAGNNRRWSGINKKIADLRDMLVAGIMKNISNVVLNTDCENATPAHAHFSFLGAEGESVLIALDLAGVAVSTGSACASGDLKPSHVLLAMGIKPEIAHNSIRFTLGKHTVAEEIRRVIKILPPIIKKLRAMAPE